MAKLKNLIKQLSDQDTEAIRKQLVDSGADKSAFLLMALRQRTQTDEQIMQDLDATPNAYYTLCSRLNQKIEEYLLQQLENPRADLLKKVATINDLVFTKNRTIILTTLKKLEKELLDYDLADELTIVYKHLRKIYLHSPEFYQYSQLYNRHVAYTLALDKAEVLLADYVKEFGFFLLSGGEEHKERLNLILQELHNTAQLYQSHRLNVCLTAAMVYHQLYVEPREIDLDQKDPLEERLESLEKIFSTYYLDPLYYYIKPLADLLRFEYCHRNKLYKTAEKHHEAIAERTGDLLMHLSSFAFPAQFLLSNLERSIRLNETAKLQLFNQQVFAHYEEYTESMPSHVIYLCYRALSCYYAENYADAARWLEKALEEADLRAFPVISLEIKSLLTLQYCCMRDYEQFEHVMNGLHRFIRMMGKENCTDVVTFIKMQKTAVSDAKREKPDKIRSLIAKFKRERETHPLSLYDYINLDEGFIKNLCYDE